MPFVVVLALSCVLAACAGTGEGQGDAGDAEPEQSPCAVSVVDFSPGERAGFGQDAMPDVVLGVPHGAGLTSGSTHVVSLGRGGTITLELGADAIDGEGADLIVFENAFEAQPSGLLFSERGVVEVSADGHDWVAFDCDAETGSGCAGYGPVNAHPENDVCATCPGEAGGDVFDLTDVGIISARFVRITDDQEQGAPPEANNAGFDLDAVCGVSQHGDQAE